MDLELKDKVVVVTGASRGIGFAVATALAREGAAVVAGARTVEALQELEGVVAVPVDLAGADGSKRLVERAVAEFGGIDHLVNNVGAVSGPHSRGLLSITDEEWERPLNVNLLSAVRASRAAVPHIAERGGAIVSISTINAATPVPAMGDYAAAKAALSTFSKALALEMGPRGVRVNTVSPGPVRTSLWVADGGLAEQLAHAMGTDADEAMAAIAGDSALGRFSEPEEVAAAVLFLLSEQAASVTGADLVVDAGTTKHA